VSRAEVDRTVTMLRRARVRWVRMNVAWDGVERDGNGIYNRGYLSQIDYAIRRVRRARIKVLIPVADGVPYWASGDPTKYIDGAGRPQWRHTYRPANWQDYADFFRFVVNRYKRYGVHTYEVWNEPNLPGFWPTGPNAAEYVEMLRAAYPAIKAAQRNARVLLGGLYPNGAYEFLQGIYAAGGGAFFDSAAFHIYPPGDPKKCWRGPDGRPSHDTFCALDQLRRIMVFAGDRRKNVWITEYGYSTCSNASPACQGVGVSARQQARYIVSFQRRIDSRSYVRVAFLYKFRKETNDRAAWETNLGILRPDFSATPAFRAFSAYNRSGR
jgi:arabinogalactan endo-1,4-beta-galactosidase